MKTVYILKGLPGSGKSTWAKEQMRKNSGNTKRINKDDLREMLDDSLWNKNNEQFILQIRDLILLEALKAGKHVIVDDTNLAPFHEEKIRTLVSEHCQATGEQVQVVVKFFEVPLEECIRRDLKRVRSVGERVIRNMHRKYLDPLPRHPKPLDQNPELPHAVICDLDGTLAILDRNPYDASTCETDTLHAPVAQIVRTYKRLGCSILILSGRFETFRPQTERWLAQHEIPYDLLLMRPADDLRKDAILKKEIFDTRIKGQWFIEFVLDDRDQVVEMWRREGLTCCQVAEGDF